jgi:O-antigen ligase
MNLIFAILLILFIFLSYRKILWGLGAVIVLLPSYLWRFDILGLPSTFLELSILSLFVIWLVKEKKYKQINFSLKSKSYNPVSRPLKYLISLWILVSMLALLINFSFSTLGLWRAYFLEPLMFFLIFVYTVRDKKDWQVIINSFGLLLAWLFAVAMYQNFTDWNYISAYNFPNVKRLTGPFAYPNALSLLTAPLTAFFAGLWIYNKQKIANWHYLLVFIFGLILAITAVSQGAILAIVISVVLALISSLASSSRRVAKKVRKLGIALIILSLIASLFILFKIDFNPELNLQSSSLDIRFNQWQETGHLLANNFLLGTGLGGYQESLETYHQTEWLEIYLYPHNIFLNFWTELGLLGLIVFTSLIIYIILLLKNIFKAKNNLAWPLLMMWLTWFVHGLVDVPYFKNDLSVLFFVFLALTFLISKHKSDE